MSIARIGVRVSPVVFVTMIICVAKNVQLGEYGLALNRGGSAKAVYEEHGQERSTAHEIGIVTLEKRHGWEETAVEVAQLAAHATPPLGHAVFDLLLR